MDFSRRTEVYKLKSLSRVLLFETPWTATYQAPLSMGFPRHEYWNGLPLPSPEDLSHPGIEPGSPTLQADTLLSEPPGKRSLNPWTTREVPESGDYSPVVVHELLIAVTSLDTEHRL